LDDDEADDTAAVADDGVSRCSPRCLCEEADDEDAMTEEDAGVGVSALRERSRSRSRSRSLCERDDDERDSDGGGDGGGGGKSGRLVGRVHCVFCRQAEAGAATQQTAR
jgi:hypothetical protein